MKLIPVVKSLRDIRKIRSIIPSVKLQLPQFQAVTIRKLSEQIVLNQVHERMRDFGYSDKIIAGTTVNNIEILSEKRFQIFFKSEYFSSSGFDVAVAREKGTRSVFVKPVTKKALHFDGNKFSKGHYRDGIIASNIIRDTLDDFAQPLLDEYKRQQRDWIEQNFGGLVQIAI